MSTSLALPQPPPPVPFPDTSSTLSVSTTTTAASPYLTPPTSLLELGLDLKQPQPQAPVDQQPIQLSISTTFHPSASLLSASPGLLPDLVIQSGDGVFFYVHSFIVRSKSSNKFGSMLSQDLRSSTEPVPVYTLSLPTPESDDPTPPASPSALQNHINAPQTELRERPLMATKKTPASPTIISIPESSPVLNVMLHLMYGMSFAKYYPSFEDLAATFPFMDKYGLQQTELAHTHSEICSSLLFLASARPLDVFTLAAQRGLDTLAVVASQYTLRLDLLTTLTNEHANAMGPTYLKRLFFLHLGRCEALKRILVKSLDQHAPGQGVCTQSDRDALSRAWGLTTAYVLSLEGGQNLSTQQMNETYASLVPSVRCGSCRTRLLEQVRGMVLEWSMVKDTI